MAIMNFGGVDENVVTREEFPLEKAREILKDETIAVIGYGVQGPGQSMNLRDNGFNIIVGQRKGSKTWDKAVADGWVPGETLFEIEEACQRGTIIEYLLSDAAQIEVWPKVKKHLTAGKTLYFSHGFAITYKERTGIVPPTDVDVVLVAPKGSGTSLRRMFLQGRGLNSSYAIFQDATGHAKEKVIALGIGVGSGYLFETTFKREVYSDLTGERGTLMGAIQGIAPITAPMLGALIADAAGWRGIFWILFGTGVVLAFITLFVFVETLPRSRINSIERSSNSTQRESIRETHCGSCVLRHRVSAAPCFRHSLRTYFFVALYFPGSL